MILDIGAGPSNATSDFLASRGTVCGVDISEQVGANRALTSWKTFDGRQMPFENNSFDFCISDWGSGTLKNLSNILKKLSASSGQAGLIASEP
jgi:ubiquinone/menaquinone biosynthesis C-methylase UbiE